jgi:hypothetical protein
MAIRPELPGCERLSGWFSQPRGIVDVSFAADANTHVSLRVALALEGKTLVTLDLSQTMRFARECPWLSTYVMVASSVSCNGEL